MAFLLLMKNFKARPSQKDQAETSMVNLVLDVQGPFKVQILKHVRYALQLLFKSQLQNQVFDECRFWEEVRMI